MAAGGATAEGTECTVEACGGEDGACEAGGSNQEVACSGCMRQRQGGGAVWGSEALCEAAAACCVGAVVCLARRSTAECCSMGSSIRAAGAEESDESMEALAAAHCNSSVQ